VSGAAGSVDDYIAGVEPERREALELLRRLCRDELNGYAEAIRYGMPSYSRDGVVEVAFASQQRYPSLYVMRQAALQAHRHRLGGLSVGKGCVRFGRSDTIDPDLVRALLRATVADTGQVC
jgi:uncharacterized protein YdhG (YjbR/CyaY superfamily)